MTSKESEELFKNKQEVERMNNIYSKMQKARCEFQEKPLKKSGHNKFAGYHYFELGDFLPTINSLLEKYNLCSNISFDNEMATLTIVNAENTDEKLVFTSPMSNANLKGCHDVQNLGAVQTYLRRYLWVNAFEIVDWSIPTGTSAIPNNFITGVIEPTFNIFNGLIVFCVLS